jgi:hypothetical protein
MTDTRSHQQTSKEHRKKVIEGETNARDAKILAPPQRLHESSCSGVNHPIKPPRQPSSLPQTTPYYNLSNTSKHTLITTSKSQPWVFLNKQTLPSRSPRPPRRQKTTWTPSPPPTSAHKTACSAPRIAQNWLEVPLAVLQVMPREQLRSSTKREWR